MEFNLFGPITGEGVNVLDSYWFRNVFDDAYQSVQGYLVEHIDYGIEIGANLRIGIFIRYIKIASIADKLNDPRID